MSAFAAQVLMVGLGALALVLLAGAAGLMVGVFVRCARWASGRRIFD